MYKHTLCFIKRNEEILMLNREYDPVKGLWNRVGGKIDFVLSNHKLIDYRKEELAKQDSSIDNIIQL
ncbi:hypothetical protein [Bacillus sp. FSL R12-0069]|uniref:hypothetical protein n=1 Tax=Bacillus sp. FSL R12-0069 TaxID=2975342 RepID=UPI0030FD15E1